MRLLLTSAGVSNPGIHDAPVAMPAKPIEECSAPCIPSYVIDDTWRRFEAGRSNS